MRRRLVDEPQVVLSVAASLPVVRHSLIPRLSPPFVSTRSIWVQVGLVSERHDIWAIADSLQMDLRAASAKLVELRSRLAALDLPNPNESKCPVCGTLFRGPRSLAQHMYDSHGADLPPHIAEADKLASNPEPVAPPPLPPSSVPHVFVEKGGLGSGKETTRLVGERKEQNAP